MPVPLDASGQADRGGRCQLGALQQQVDRGEQDDGSEQAAHLAYGCDGPQTANAQIVRAEQGQIADHGGQTAEHHGAPAGSQRLLDVFAPIGMVPLSHIDGVVDADAKA